MPTPPAPARPGGDWRASLDALRDPDGELRGGTRADARAERGPFRELGLQLAPRHLLRRSSEQWQGARDEPAADAASVDRIAVRPVVRGARGGWAKGDLTWQNIAYKGEGAGVDPAQARWFAQFALLKGGNPGTYNPYGSAWITLDAYESPLLWALLAEAGRLGISLAGTDAASRVRLHDSARVVLDARLDASALTLAPALELDGAPGPIAGTRPIGDHGVVRCDLDAGILDLAPLAEPQNDGADLDLGAVVAFMDKVAARTRDVKAEDIEDLKTAGVADPDIVRLCELNAFLAYQIRVVAGLKLMRGEK